MADSAYEHALSLLKQIDVKVKRLMDNPKSAKRALEVIDDYLAKFEGYDVDHPKINEILKRLASTRQRLTTPAS